MGSVLKVFLHAKLPILGNFHLTPEIICIFDGLKSALPFHKLHPKSSENNTLQILRRVVVVRNAATAPNVEILWADLVAPGF